MKNKLPLIISTLLISMPLLVASGYFLVKNADSSNFLLALAGFACTLGSGILILFTFWLPKSLFLTTDGTLGSARQKIKVE